MSPRFGLLPPQGGAQIEPIARWVAFPASGCSDGGMSVGADDLEVLVDEDVVRPVDADVVNLVGAVVQLNNTVDDAPRVGGQRRFRRPIRRCSADNRSRSLTVVRRFLTDLL